MGVPQILVLFFIIRSIIQFVKKSIDKSFEWENVIAFVLGGLATLVWATGLTQLGGLPVPDSSLVASIIEFLLFGVAASEGSAWLHEFINIARTNNNE